jgi:hypothetical protein
MQEEQVEEPQLKKAQGTKLPVKILSVDYVTPKLSTSSSTKQSPFPTSFSSLLAESLDLSSLTAAPSSTFSFSSSSSSNPNNKSSQDAKFAKNIVSSSVLKSSSESPVVIHNSSIKYMENQIIHMQCIVMKGSAFVWIGSSPADLSNLSISLTSPFVSLSLFVIFSLVNLKDLFCLVLFQDSQPSVTTILGKDPAISQSLSQQLGLFFLGIVFCLAYHSLLLL